MNGWLEVVTQDTRHAARTLLRRPGFTITVVLTLALGIGANTAVFSLIDAVILRPLPVERPQELSLLSPAGYFPGSSSGGHALSYTEYRDVRDKAQVFNSVLCRFRTVANARVQGATKRIVVEMVSGNYFQTLGVKAALGRTITREDDAKPGAYPVAVLSYSYWINSFAGSREALGQTISINGQPFTVIGVSAKGFDGVEPDLNPAVRTPISMTEQIVPYMPWIRLESAGSRWVQVIGRRKPGVTGAQAQAALQPIYQASHAVFDGQLSQEDKVQMRQASLEVLPGAAGISYMRRDWTMPLAALMAMVGLVLVLTCVNVANLHLANGLRRQSELATRMALGAGRARVVARLLIESILVALLGGAVGLALTSYVAQLVLPFMESPEGPANFITRVDWRVFGFGFLITTTAALAFGLAPALMSTRLSLSPALRRAAAGGVAGGGLRRVLVTAQVSMSLVLMIGSALFMRSLDNLYNVDAGITTARVVVFGVDPVMNGYPRERVEDFYDRLRDRLQSAPGVESIGLGLVRVMGGDNWTTSIGIKGDGPPRREGTYASVNVCSSGYFRTLGIRFIAGRDFVSTDRAGSPPVVVVNETFAKEYYHRTDIVGREFFLPDPTGTKQVRIVGLVEDAKYDTVKSATPPQVFIPERQFFTIMGMNCYVRGRGEASQLFGSIREAARQIDPTVPIHAMRTLEEQRRKCLALDRCVASVATAFAGLASLLAAVGLYGLLSYTVSRRTRELGLRIAVGARGSDVIRLVLREAFVLWGVGAIIGILAALGLGRLIANLLHGVSPSDPWLIAAATALLTVITTIAAALPARRASKISPMEALRCD